MVKLKIKLLRETTKIPSYATEGSGCVDLFAAIDRELIIAPQQVMAIATGIAIELPVDYVALVISKSGLALKNGVSVANSPGVIDSDFRGEVMVILQNLGSSDFVVAPGMKVAQMMCVKIDRMLFDITDSELSSTNRGSGGFGSTGAF